MPGSQTHVSTTLDVEALARLRLAVMRLARLLRQHAETGSTPSQISALATIERLGPLALGELAATERVGSSTVTKVVAALETARLVVRTTDPTDRRVALLRVTTEGSALLARGRASAAAYLGDRAATLDEADLEAMAAALPALERLVAQ